MKKLLVFCFFITSTMVSQVKAHPNADLITQGMQTDHHPDISNFPRKWGNRLFLKYTNGNADSLLTDPLIRKHALELSKKMGLKSLPPIIMTDRTKTGRVNEIPFLSDSVVELPNNTKLYESGQVNPLFLGELAHEFGHIKHNHRIKKVAGAAAGGIAAATLWAIAQNKIMKKIQTRWHDKKWRKKAITALKVLGLIGMIEATLLSTHLTEKIISRRLEKEADLAAAKAGKSKELADFLQKDIDAGFNLGGRLFDVHPKSSERVKYLRAYQAAHPTS